jgi:hypothetical protein
MMHRTLTLTLTGCMAMLPLTAAAQLKDGMSGAEVIDAVEKREDGQDMVADVLLEYRAKAGPPRLRKFTLMRKEYPGETKWVVFFHAPADVRNMGFLVWDLQNDADRRWVYMPEIRQVRRLSVGDERKAFFGTDFVYEDMTNRDASMDEHTIVGSEKHKDWDCVVVESKPKNARIAEFAKMKRWISKKHALMVKIETYDGEGRLMKQGWLETISEKQGFTNWGTGIMKNVQEGSETKMVFEPQKYNSGITDVAFTESQLSRGAP